MALLDAAVGSGMLRLRLEVGIELAVGEAAPDHFAKAVRLLVGSAVDTRFMGEFEAEAVVAKPADHAFDGPVLAELKLDLVPQLETEVAADHRAAAGKIDKFDLASVVAEADAHGLVEQSVTV